MIAPGNGNSSLSKPDLTICKDQIGQFVIFRLTIGNDRPAAWRVRGGALPGGGAAHVPVFGFACGGGEWAIEGHGDGDVQR